ncbi:hypothetical protein K435DRAFT_962380 [Dendrothele bispora CBS 962.96]|uniref:F-box domain-containing protein n=1 Tax=Dendrothele bispora (strain CBS 962.96) TaxID=1314807 RepID=A0A4S8MMK8_DENBC|nr:hypothetical protein K435DRAFT_962380 [Dendrothele bispora CBS 962.96]
MADPVQVLPCDIISVILLFLLSPHPGIEEYDALFNCSLVNWAFNQEASKLLYLHITFHRSLSSSFNLRDNGLLEGKTAWNSALLPQYAPFVRHLKINGVMSERHPPKNQFPEALLNAVKSFVNLSSVTFTTKGGYIETFTEPLRLLPELSSLDAVNVGGDWLDEKRAHLLTELKRLRKVSIISPSRAMLDLLPGWLKELKDDLMELHLLNDCGSITPGVLSTIIRSLHNIRSFSMGLSFSITDHDLFNAISQLSCLEDLGVYYYYQQMIPWDGPSVPSLRFLTVTIKDHPFSAQMFESLSKWIQRIIYPRTLPRPRVESLRISEDNCFYARNDIFKFDSLVYHLAAKHANSLRVLDMPTMFISVRALKVLFEQCGELEELSFSSGKNLLTQFREQAHSLTKLHTVGLYVRHAKWRDISIDEVESMYASVPSLRSLAINGEKWDGFWTSSEVDGGKFTFQIKPRKKRPFAYAVITTNNTQIFL